jgi:hypothetical protein
MSQVSRPTWLLLAASILLAGCATMDLKMEGDVEVGRPIGESALSQIVIGETTRSDLFRLFGPPHSIFQGQAELTEFVGDRFYSYEQSRSLSSLEDEHYAMLYQFAEVSGEYQERQTLILTHLRGRGKSRLTLEADELLLFINRETNVVDDVAYPK